MNQIQRFNDYKNEFLKNKGKYEKLLSQKNEKLECIQKLLHDKEVLDKTRLLLLKTGEFQRTKVKEDLEDMVSKALQYVREEEIYFEITVDELRGRAECNFKIKTIRDGIATITDVIDSRGDGISDIVCLALNIAMIELSGMKGPIIFDEPAKQVSKKYIDNIGLLLQELSVAFNRQIIMITHNKQLMQFGDNKIEVELIGTKSFVNTNNVSI